MQPKLFPAIILDHATAPSILVARAMLCRGVEHLVRTDREPALYANDGIAAVYDQRSGSILVACLADDIDADFLVACLGLESLANNWGLYLHAHPDSLDTAL